MNAWFAEGGRAVGVKAGESHVEVGTLGGYGFAIQLLRPASAAGLSAAD